MNKKLIICIIVFATAVFYTTQSYGLVMGPSRFEATLPPGEIADADYYVQNDTDRPAHIVVEPENWFKEVYNYGKLDIKDWIELDSYKFDLKPKEIKKLRLRIKVPTDVKGELVAQIFFTSAVMNEDGTQTEGIKARVGGVLYVAIKGTEKVDARITNISISKKPEGGKIKFLIEAGISSKSNIHLRPTGMVTIKDRSGKKLAELDLVSDKTLLPGGEVVYQVTWDNPALDAGEYQISVVMSYGQKVNIEKTASLEKIFRISKDGKVEVI